MSEGRGFESLTADGHAHGGDCDVVVDAEEPAAESVAAAGDGVVGERADDRRKRYLKWSQA